MADSLFVRQDVWTLSRFDPWHPVIDWYARGITTLKSITDTSDPRSWRHLANIHGTTTPRAQWPQGVDNHEWNACQHGSWFFLPWHRMYLHHLEKILRAVIVSAGGPSDWALPYWNYDPADPQTLKLPPAFRDERHHGKDNPLFIQDRDPDINDGDPLPDDDVETSGWSDRFAAKSPVVPTFGGPKTGWTHMGPGVGQLELEPHGSVHVDVGGLMSTFETAAQDPIFWLHHANIDRLWEVWKSQPGRRNPKGDNWLRADYRFGSGQWTTALDVSQVLDTTSAPLRYRYEDKIEQEVAMVEEPPSEEPQMAEADDDEVAPELVGASEQEVPLRDSVTVSVDLSEPKGPVLERAAARGKRRTYLTLENVKGSGLGAGKYVVYVNLPEGADPAEHKDRRAGRFSTFGLPEESLSDETHSGSGMTYSFDITDLVPSLEAKGDWDPSGVRVTIVPRRHKRLRSEEGDIRVGRVGVYVE